MKSRLALFVVRSGIGGRKRRIQIQNVDPLKDLLRKSYHIFLVAINHLLKQSATSCILKSLLGFHFSFNSHRNLRMLNLSAWLLTKCMVTWTTANEEDLSYLSPRNHRHNLIDKIVHIKTHLDSSCKDMIVEELCFLKWYI